MCRILPLIALLAPAAFGAWLPGSHVEAQTWRTVTSARQIWDGDPVNVQIRYGAGRLSIGPVDAPMLYLMEVRYDEEMFLPLATYDENDRTLRLGVESSGRNHRSINLREGSTASIGLTRNVTLDLDLEFGAGKAEIELGGIALRRISISTGASESTVRFSTPNPVTAENLSIEAGAADLRVSGLGNARAERITFQGGVGATVLDFSGAWDGDAVASVQMGIGSVTLRLPRSHGIRVNRSSFLTSFAAPGLRQQGNSYFSGNWDSAPQKLTIDVSAALGAIEIQWID